VTTTDLTSAAPSPELVEELAHPTADEVAAMDAWWRANNYLTVGQIYLMANPLLRDSLSSEHIKPRLLGHWGTSPGLSFIYTHASRLIQRTAQEMLYLTGPGHGGPALVAASYLEGTYSEIYPHVTQDAEGMRRLFRQFSAPGGIPSHVSVTTPGSIHEGGELGYVLVHAFGAVMDNPNLIALAIVGDGEAETGPLEGSWKGVSFLNPARDGAVLPILHLNGAKISGPTVLARKDPAEVRSLLEGHGYEVLEVAGADLPGMHHRFADALTRAWVGIRTIQTAARTGSWDGTRPRWPMIVLRSPKGWTGPDVVDGVRVGGSWRLPTRGAVRRGRRAVRAGAPGQPRGELADERDSACQRWAADPRSSAPRLPRLRRRGSPTGSPTRGVDSQAWGADARRLSGQPGSLPLVLP
jgi:xylulose-5-phosphate/fructose-6-phosphate phosphoketolase